MKKKISCEQFLTEKHTLVLLAITIITMMSLLFSCQKKNGGIHNDGKYIIYKNLIEEYDSIEQSNDRQKADANASEIRLSNGKIIQPFHTSFDYYALTPSDCQLYVKLQKGHRRVSGFVEIQTNDSEVQRFQFDKNGSHQVDLSPWEGKHIRLRFGATSKKNPPQNPSDYYIEWENILLRMAKSDEVSGDEKADAGQAEVFDTERFQQYDVVYIVLDAFHAPHASLYGYSRETTPFLDSLAQESVVFDNMFANASYTLASTGVLFTSRYVREHGLIAEQNVLSRVIPTIAELLTAANVETYLITIHGYLLGDWGLARGFSNIIKENFGLDFNSSRKVVEQIYASNSSKRKFMYIHIGPPHTPYHPPEKFRKFIKEVKPDHAMLDSAYMYKFEHQELKMDEEQLEYILSWYDSNILFADSIAQIVFDVLKKQGALENTIFIVTSDHGEAFLQHGKVLHGSTIYDEMLHIPFLIRFPKEAGIRPKRVRSIASLVDITPTLADIYGLKELPKFSGKNLLPLLMGESSSLNPFIYAESPGFSESAIRDLEYKYILSAQGQQLYHLPGDALEQSNLNETHPITTRYYHQLMKTFLAQYPLVSSNTEVDLEQQDESVLQNLKDLGYIK